LVVADSHELQIEFAARRHAVSDGYDEKANLPVTSHLQPSAAQDGGISKTYFSQTFDIPAPRPLVWLMMVDVER
jgi:hypothetical protein